MGKGVWIWKLGQCEGGNVAAVIAKAQRAGLTRVLVKVADGLNPYNDTTKLHALADGLHAAGIDCWGWGWSYGGSASQAAAEANVAGHRVVGLGLHGYVLDAEVQYEQSGSAAWATAYCDRIRQVLETRPLGLTSYWSPVLHPEIPWRAFAQHVDYWWPQVYWYNRNPSTVLKASMAELAAYGKEVIPLGAADPGDGCNSGLELGAFGLAVNANLALHHGADFYQWSDIPGANWTIIRDWVPRT
jgi:hypothetical protein